MLVGNDVVDLRDAESRPESLHARFDGRVFTPCELLVLNASTFPDSLRWTLWAAKESAYKVAKKLDPTVRFIPRNFVVRGIAEGRVVPGRVLVAHEVGSFDVLLDRTREWVHAVATLAAENAPPPQARFCSEIERLESPRADPSRFVRELACTALGSAMTCPPGQVRVAAARGIPVAVLRDRRLPVDLSLSHHGRFVAWVYSECAIPDDPKGFAAA